jgi:hypothetical protein
MPQRTIPSLSPSCSRFINACASAHAPYIGSAGWRQCWPKKLPVFQDLYQVPTSVEYNGLQELTNEPVVEHVAAAVFLIEECNCAVVRSGYKNPISPFQRNIMHRCGKINRKTLTSTKELFQYARTERMRTTHQAVQHR